MSAQSVLLPHYYRFQRLDHIPSELLNHVLFTSLLYKSFSGSPPHLSVSP